MIRTVTLDSLLNEPWAFFHMSSAATSLAIVYYEEVHRYGELIYVSVSKVITGDNKSAIAVWLEPLCNIF